MARKTLGPSEFEGNGVKPFGGFGIATAWEKVRILFRTEQDPETSPDLDAPADKWRHGGIEDPNQVIP